MREISYNFSLKDVAARLINPIPDIEDGYWQIVPLIETASPAVIPQMYPGQIEDTLPGAIVRLAGFKVNQVSGPGLLTYKVKDRYIVTEEVPSEDPGSTQQ
jgi:hypothetical protein